MSNKVAFMSESKTFSPDMKELIEQTVETLKLDVIQGLAYEKVPKLFNNQGIHKNPSLLGKSISNRLTALAPSAKRNRPSFKDTSPLSLLYTADERKLARKHNVDLMSKTAIFKQFDVSKKFAFMANDISNRDRIKTHSENLFGIEIYGVNKPMTPQMALAAAAPALNLDPAITRMLLDRKYINTIDWGSVFSDTSSGNETDDDDTAPPQADPIQINRGLKFRLHRVKCIDETNPESFGDDEIAAGGVASNWNLETSKISEFRVGNSFDDGESRSYDPPLVLKNFSLDDVQYPANFSVVMALAEKDNGGLSSFISELWEKIREHVDTIIVAVGAAAGVVIGAGAGGATGTAIGGPLGLIIGAAVGAIVGALVGWLIGASKDDIFRPQIAAVQLPEHNSTFENGSQTSPLMNLNFEDHGGYYRAYYTWQIVR